MCSEKDPLSHFKRLQMGIYLIFHRKRLEPRVFCYGNNSRCHFVSVVMFVCGAKFEELCLNISS